MASTPFSDLKLPEFQVDPNYTDSQKTLSDLGKGILSGNLPSYYQNLGQANSPAFQSMLASVMKNVQQGVMNNAAQSGTARSGTVASATADAQANIVPQLTYQDFLNSQQQQGALLNLGTNIESGVRSSGQTQQEQNFNAQQAIFGDQLQQQNAINAYKQQGASATGAGIGGALQGIASLGLAPFTDGASLAGLPGAVGTAFGGTASGISSIGSILPFLQGYNSPVTAPGGGKIQDPNFGSFSSLKSSNPATMNLLDGFNFMGGQ